MFKQLLLNAHLESWGMGTLVLFFLVFVAMLIWVFRKDSKSQYEELSQLPLESSFIEPS